MEKSAEEVSAILRQYLSQVRIDDRSPNAEPLRVLLEDKGVFRDTYSWKATVRPSRMPRRWTYFYEEIGVLTEELLAKAGLNVFFNVDEPSLSEDLTPAAT